MKRVHKKAYKNEDGHIMTVFKDDNGEYGVFIRMRENGPFQCVKMKFPRRATIREAENDLNDAVERSKCKTWYEVEDWWRKGD